MDRFILLAFAIRSGQSLSMRIPVVCAVLLVAFLSSAAEPNSQNEEGFKPLFPKEGVPDGWMVRAWADVKNPPPAGAVWKVTDGVLHGSEPRGTWLVSEKLYADFVLKFEWKLGERGNSGCGLRFPDQGDPAFDGLELQMVDPRYYPPEMGRIPANELTGSLYRAIAPKEQLLKPLAWNTYEITCKGPNVRVVLNGAEILNVNIKEYDKPIKRHDDTDAVPFKDRPLRGHIGFQELSRGGGHVEIRNARIRVDSPQNVTEGSLGRRGR
jgi:hypothetical protein